MRTLETNCKLSNSILIIIGKNAQPFKQTKNAFWSGVNITSLRTNQSMVFYCTVTNPAMAVIGLVVVRVASISTTRF